MNRLAPAVAVLLCVAAFGCANNGHNESEMYEESNSTTQTSTTDQTQQTTTGTVSDEQLDEFARIAQEIDQIRMQTEKKLQTAQSEEAAKKIRQEAYKEVKALFRESEMTEAEYQDIAQQLKNNPELQERLRKRLEE